MREEVPTDIDLELHIVISVEFIEIRNCLQISDSRQSRCLAE